MSGEHLKKAAITLFGERGWQSALASHLEIDRTQVWRYITTGRLPGPVKAAVRAWLRHGMQPAGER